MENVTTPCVVLTTWPESPSPYEAARVRVLIGQACHDLADREGAELELAAARAVFTRLGAAPDLEAVGKKFAHLDGRNC